MLLRSRCQKTILFAIVATTAQCSALARCHAPDGTTSPLDQPCYPSASDSFCCPPSSICSSNKLCILTGGQALRGSCADASFSSPACPNFCLNREAGLRHSADLHMTLWETDPDSTVYCCNGESSNACDCSARSSSKVRLKLFNPITIISSARPGAPSASLIKAIVNTRASATSPASRFLQKPIHQLQGLFIPWKTLRPILRAVLLVIFFVSVIWLIHRACLARRSRDARRASAVVEVGLEQRYGDWAVHWDDNDTKSKSNFSIGSFNSEVSPSDTGKVIGARKEVDIATKSDEHEKTSLEICLEEPLERAYLGRQGCESEPTKDLNKTREQGMLSKTEHQRKTRKIEVPPTNQVNCTITRQLEDMLNTPFVGRQDSLY